MRSSMGDLLPDTARLRGSSRSRIPVVGSEKRHIWQPQDQSGRHSSGRPVWCGGSGASAFSAWVALDCARGSLNRLKCDLWTSRSRCRGQYGRESHSFRAKRLLVRDRKTAPESYHFRDLALKKKIPARVSAQSCTSTIPIGEGVE